MPFSIHEAYESQNGETGRDAHDDLAFIVIGDPVADGADDGQAVMAWVYTQVATPIPYGLANGNVLDHFTRKKIGPGQWRVEPIYRSPNWVRTTGDGAFSFTTGGGTQHITLARSTVATYANTDALHGAPVPDLQGAINVQNGQIMGIDIEVPVFEFKSTHYTPGNTLNAVIGNMYRYTGSVNSATLVMAIRGVTMTYAPGELKYRGAEGQERVNYADFEISLQWSASPNATGLTVGPITGINKRGWDYLDVGFGDGTDATSAWVIQQPLWVTILNVFPYNDLSTIIPPVNPASVPGWIG